MLWTWRDENDERDTEELTDEGEATLALLNEVASRIAGLRQTREERGFIAQAYFDDHGHLPGEDFANDDDAAAIAQYRARREVQRRVEDAEEEALLKILHEHGARMLRPYEHWGEDERLMAYLERDRYE